jgi:hypothetical protein
MNLLRILTFSSSLIFSLFTNAQTSWKGTTSTSWSTSSNWTNGIPSASVDAIVGDANFTGTNQPAIGSSASCKSLTIGGGVKASTLTVNRNLTVYGAVTINSNGTLNHGGSTISLTGNWLKSGTYSTSSNKSTVIFSGVSQTLGGTSSTTFRKLTINSGSTVTLAQNVTVSGTQSRFTVSGTVNPGESPTYLVTAGSITVNSGGIIHVKATTFGGNYSSTPTLNAGSTVEYSSSTNAQTILNSITYSTLNTSGTTTKTLAGNLNTLLSSSSSVGNINVNGGTLDLSSFTANRGTSVTGGNFVLASGTTLKIGGTATFPTNYNNVSLSLGSTVEYYGTNQTIGAVTYGNLNLIAGSGSVTKTMPATVFSVLGNLTASLSSGTSLAFTAANNFNVGGNFTLNTSTTYNGGSFTTTLGGNLINAGTYNGGTGTTLLNGPGKTISGAGTYNFNNLTITDANISASATTIGVSGNFATTGSAVFTHNTGGTLTFTGVSKTVTGIGISFNNLTIGSGASISSTSTHTISGNITNNGTFTCSSGSTNLSGSTKTISGSGTTGFFSVNVTGTITANSNVNVGNSLNVSGSYAATAGTTTFTGSSALNGTANLFNVTINGTQLRLATNANMGVAGSLSITSGTIDITTSTPNTINFNGTGAQSINALTYDNLTFSNSGTKTASGGITIRRALTISSGATFNASSFTHNIYGNFNQSGTFTASTSTFQYNATGKATINGVTTFNNLTINNNTGIALDLNNNVSVANLTVNTGSINTLNSTITVTSTRTGNGIILGTVKHHHAFTTGVAYTFEGPYTSVTFSGVSANSVTSITISTVRGAINNFPYGSAINRTYDVSYTGSMATCTATARFHYEDAELNGNTESSLVHWYYDSSSWNLVGKSNNDTINNYVEDSGIADIASRWTLAENASVVTWVGVVDDNWFEPGNWAVSSGTPTIPPTALEIVELGKTGVTYQPTISAPAAVRSIAFYSGQPVTLTIGTGGSLTSGNIDGEWTQSSTHNISVGGGSLTVTGDLTLGDNVANNIINLSVGTGTITVSGSFTQNQGCSLVFNAAGTLIIGEDFVLNSGIVVPGLGTIKYNGLGSQQIAGINYYNLIVDKGSGVAAGITSRSVIGNAISVLNGELDILAPIEVYGDVNISSTGILDGGSDTIYVKGNWNNSGTFVPSLGTICFNGTSTQSIGASTFNNFVLNKSAGNTNLNGNLSISGSVNLILGTLNLSTYSFNRLALGGSFIMAGSTSLSVSGASNFPANYTTYTLDTTSTINFDGTVVQAVNGGISYGSLAFSNGSSNAKTLNENIDVKGNLTINSGATFATGSNAIYLYGNWTNSGSFTPGTGSLIFSGAQKTITGNTTFNKVTINGQYTVNGSNITLNDKFQVSSTGSYTAGSGLHVVNGDLINSGSLSSTGTTTFSGTVTQNIQFINSILSVSTGVINFNGTVTPVLNSNSSPTYANLNINNTGGVTASVPWRIYGDLTVGTGATFNAGNFTDTIAGNVTNNGTIISSGTLHFFPTSNVTLALGTNKLTSTGILRFGGSGLLTITGTPTTVTDVIISNTNASGVTLPAGWTINGNLTIRSSAILNASSYTYNVLGHIESNGTLNGGTSTFIMQSADGEISANTTTTFYNFTINNGATLTINSDFNISGNLVNNGTIDVTSTGSPRITGTSGSTISGTNTAVPQLIVAKTNATATLGMNLTTVGDLSVESGTFSTSTYSITQDPGGGALTVHDNATLKLEGTNALPTFTSIALDTLSTVEYAGTTQTVTSGNDYGNLTISASGNKTANGVLNVVGNLALSAGTFIGGSFSHNIQGNWNMTGGTFTNTGTTIVLSGPYTQTVKSTGAFNNLTINKSQNTVYDSTDITINGTLTFTSGNISTGSFKIILPNGASVSRTSGHVIGTLQKHVVAGTPTVNYEIGDVGGYAPTSLVFSGVSVAGSIAVGAVSGDHADIVNSQLNGAKSVNRKWTITNTGATFTSYSATFNYLSGDVDGGATTSSFYTSKYNGGSWLVPAIGTRTATSAQATGITTIGEFVIGELYARVWDGGASTTNWGDANNWNPDGVPTSTEGAWVQIGSSVQINSTVSIDNVKLNHASAALSLTTGGALTINGELNLATGSVSINNQTLTLNGTINASGTGTITGSANANLVIGGTTGGDFGTLRMTSTSPNNRVRNFTLNRTGASAEATIGSNGLEVTNLVTITNGVLQSNGNLTLISDNSGTARVGQITSPADLSGNVTVQRYVPAVARRSRMISPNVSGFTFADLKDDMFITGTGGVTNGFDASTSNGHTVYTYQESTTGGRGWKGITNINNSLPSGVGAIAFVRGDRTLASPQWYTPPYVSQNAVTVDFLGNINKGVFSPTITYTNTGVSANDGWNLLGNPYPCPIDWNALSKSNLASFYYVFDPSTNAYIANNGTLNIASGQGFFVQAIGASPSITFTESAKVVTDVTGNFKTSANPFKIEIRKDSLNADFVWLNINANASRSYNPAEDALKFTNASINLSFMGHDSVLQQYLSSPINTVADTFKLDLQTPTGTYTLNFSNYSSLPNNSGAYFIDKYNQTVLNLATTNNYTFSVSGGNALTYGQRFMIVIKNAVPLPVKLLNFTANKHQKDVMLTWQTASEMNNKGFEIERKTASDLDWQIIAFVPALKSTLNNKYNYVDGEVNTNQTVYYRLKQMDNDGKSTTSNIVAVGFDGLMVEHVQVFPNPAINDFNIEVTTEKEEAAQVLINDVSGQPVLNNTQNLKSGKNVFTYGGLKSGVYFVEIITSDKKSIIKLLIK